MEQTYTVNLDDGTQQVWTGVFPADAVPAANCLWFLHCTDGTLINVAHIVTMVPVG